MVEKPVLKASVLLPLEMTCLERPYFYLCKDLHFKTIEPMVLPHICVVLLLE